jgi:hypothetical protein
MNRRLVSMAAEQLDQRATSPDACWSATVLAIVVAQLEIKNAG